MRFDPHASEEERRSAIRGWRRFNQGIIKEMIERTAEQDHLSNVPAIEHDYFEYANYHVYGELLPDDEEMLYGHSKRNAVHELPDLSQDFIQQVIDECLTYERWKPMYIAYALPKIVPLLSDQYSENQIRAALTKYYEQSPYEAINYAGSIDSALAYDLIRNFLDVKQGRDIFNESEKLFLKNYVSDVASALLSDLGIREETFARVGGVAIEQWVNVITCNLAYNIEDCHLLEQMPIQQVINTNVVQAELDEDFRGMQQGFEDNLPTATLEKLDGEVQDPQTYMYVRQHMSELGKHFDNVVCYLQGEIDVDTFLANVFPEMTS